MIFLRPLVKLTASVTFVAVMVFMIPPVFAGANPWKEERGHPQRFWNSKSPDPATMVLDGLLVRPASFVATVLGGAFYIVTLPFSAAGGNSDKAWDQMVKAPARATFVRPLGVFYLDFEDQEEISADTAVPEETDSLNTGEQKNP